MHYRTAIVTGGAGFVGSHLVDALVARGVAVTVIDKQDAPLDRKNPAADYRKMDIKDAGVRGVFAAAKPDVVFHLAAHIDDRESLQKPVLNAEDNILGSLNVFEAARACGVKKIIFTSTGILYGNVDEIPTTEEATPRPVTPYGVSKLAGERYLHFYWLLYKLPYVAIRPANIYGPRQDASRECGAVAIFTSRLLMGSQPIVNGDGMTTRDYVHVDDVVLALLAGAHSEAVGVFNIGTGVETTTVDLLKKICTAVGTECEPQWRPEVTDAVRRCALGIRKAQKDLGWSPTIALDDGLAKTVTWYKSRL